MTYTIEQIAQGIALAQCWYEGWRFEDLEPNQILEAINAASIPVTVYSYTDAPYKVVSAEESWI